MGIINENEMAEFIVKCSGTEQIAERLQMRNFLQSFAFTDKVEGKRFDRFVSKAKEAILDLYIARYFPMLFLNDEFSVYSVEDAVLLFFQDYFQWEGRKKEKKNTFYLLDTIWRHAAISGEGALENDAWKIKAVSSPHESHDGNIPVMDIITSEIHTACRYFIREKCTWKDSGISETNYFQALPENPFEAGRLFEMILQGVYFDIEIMARNPAARDAQANPELAASVQKLKKQNESQKIKIQELEAALQKREQDIAKISADAKKEKKELLEKNEKELKKQIKELLEEQDRENRIIQKLKENHDSVVRKYADLRKQIVDDEPEAEIRAEKEAIQEYKNPDPDGRYVFFADENTSFKNNLSAMFPNSTFYTSSVSLSEMKVDMVIINTAHIKHSDYYKIKQQCSDYGIPFVQTRYSNAELIYSLMWEMVNFGKCTGYRNSSWIQN